MNIKSVKIKNFRGYGKNLDSKDKFYTFDNLNEFEIIILNGMNGNGKTSFYEAIEWGLTGNIKRLDNIMKDTDKRIQRKSNHLIFNDNKGKIRDQAIVLIEFDNGYILERKTNSNSIIKCEQETKLITNQQIYANEEAESVLKNLITDRNIELKKIYKTISLGQETLAAFMREEKTTERGKILLNLFNLEEFEEVKSKSESSKFSNLNHSTYKQNLEKIELEKNDINNTFKICGFTIEEYIKKSNNDYLIINEMIGNAVKVDREESKLKNSLEALEYIQSIKSDLIKNVATKRYGNKNLLELAYLEKLNETRRNIEIIESIKDANKDQLKKKKHILEKRSVKYKNRTDKFIGYKKRIKESLYKINQIIINIDDIPLCNDKIDLLYKETEDVLTKEKYEKFKELNRKLKKIYNENNISIKLIETEIKSLSSINNEYNEALNNIKDYILKNEIDRCPVCMSDNIEEVIIVSEENKEFKDKILEVINMTLTNNNNKIKSKLKIEDNYKKERIKIKDRYEEEIIKTVNSLKESIINKKELSIRKIELIQTKINGYLQKIKIEIEEIDESIAKIEIVENKIMQGFKKHIELKDIKVIYEKRYKLLSDIVTNKFEIYNISQIDKDIYRLKEATKINSVANAILRIKENKAEISKMSKLIDLISKYESKYNLSNANLSKLKKYDEYLKEEKKYIRLEEERINYKEDRKNIYDIVDSKSNELLTKKMDKYKGLGNYIYKSISPHPSFNEFEFEPMYGGYEVTLQGNKNINLSHIFSNAQTNILALSIFLGIGLLDNGINIEQLFIDDPIQSMDDINVLAFIDLLRSIVLSKSINKKLIISTHNSNFASLLKIKLRNINYKEIKFTYYGEEGPRIKETYNKI